MPLPVENLTPETPLQLVREAISQSIEICMNEGKSQKECATIAYQYARDLTGKELMEGKTR